jgi:hypothetical protein
VTTSVEGEAAPGRENGGGNVNWADANLTGPKNKKNHVVDSVATIVPKILSSMSHHIMSQHIYRLKTILKIQ